MLVYTSYGKRDFGSDPATEKSRNAWEFWALLSGNIRFDIDPSHSDERTSATLFAFPAGLWFGCTGHGLTERAVFDFNVVPPELSGSLPRRGYYRIPIGHSDSDRIRKLAQAAAQLIANPNQFSFLQQQTIAGELSLIALKDVRPKPLPRPQKALIKVEQVMAWYASNMMERPRMEDICQTHHVSPSHLRRQFHTVLNKSPKTAFIELQMERAENLLTNSERTIEDIAERVGLCDATALNRAIKQHFGMTPGNLRKVRRKQTERGF